MSDTRTSRLEGLSRRLLANATLYQRQTVVNSILEIFPALVEEIALLRQKTPRGRPRAPEGFADALDYSLGRRRSAGLPGSRNWLARTLKWSPSTVYRKMDGERHFTMADAKKITALFKQTPESFMVTWGMRRETS